MPYTPTNWQTGDIVTSEKLNKIENELASPSPVSGGVVCHVTFDGTNTRTDMTAQQLVDAYEAGKYIVVIDNCTYASHHLKTYFVNPSIYMLQKDGSSEYRIGISVSGGYYRASTLSEYFCYVENAS